MRPYGAVPAGPLTRSVPTQKKSRRPLKTAPPCSCGALIGLLQPEADLERHLVVRDPAVLDVAARGHHLEPLDVAQRLRRLGDRVVDRQLDSLGRAARDLDALVDVVVAHRARPYQYAGPARREERLRCGSSAAGSPTLRPRSARTRSRGACGATTSSRRATAPWSTTSSSSRARARTGPATSAASCWWSAPAAGTGARATAPATRSAPATSSGSRPARSTGTAPAAAATCCTWRCPWARRSGSTRSATTTTSGREGAAGARRRGRVRRPRQHGPPDGGAARRRRLRRSGL